MAWAASLTALLALTAAGCGDASSAGRAAQPITGDEVRAFVRVLAADSMEGRGAGTRGYERAARYAAQQLAAVGAQPLRWPGADSASWFQRVPLVLLGDDPAGALEIEDARGRERVPLTGERLVVLVPGKLAAPVAPAPPVFVGYGLVAEGWNDYAGLDARGRLVLAIEGPPDSAHVPAMPAAVRRRFADPVAANNAKVGAAMRHGAAAVLILPPPSGLDWDAMRRARPRVMAAWTEPGLPVRDHGTPVVGVHDLLVERIFAGDGVHLYRPGTRYRAFELAHVRLGLRLDERRQPVASPNVVAWVPGRDPRLRGEYVVVSAHLDALGTQNGKIFPGANDDASGSAVVLALARAFARHPPRRSVIFALFTGEEAGLLGSRWFAGHLPVPRGALKADLNLEHMGLLEVRPCLVLAPAALRGAADAGRRAAPGLRLDVLEPALAPGIYASSDNDSFSRIGVPAISFGCGGDAVYHSPADRASGIAPATLRQTAAAAQAMLRELAGGVR